MAEKSISIDKAWEILFDRHDIAKQVAARGSFRISSADINTVKEARLMAKFDQSTQLPAIFKENKLSILPISRGEYIIGGFETHAKIKYDSVRPTPVPVPNLQTIDYTNLYSESSALLFAYNSGIIADILGGEAVFTVNGRMSSGSFSYWVRNNRLPAGEQHLDVVNAQVEIDAGYESRDALMLCEAKNVAVDELLIRQLYYPYRLWSSKISKPILPVFLVYSNDVFHAFIYRFFDREFYNSLELVEHKAYTFADEDIHLKDVVDIWNSIQCTEEPPITFPQADTFSRIVDILSVLYEKTMTPEEVRLKYDFDAGRPATTYRRASIWGCFTGTPTSMESGSTPSAGRPKASWSCGTSRNIWLSSARCSSGRCSTRRSAWRCAPPACRRKPLSAKSWRRRICPSTAPPSCAAPPRCGDGSSGFSASCVWRISGSCI